MNQVRSTSMKTYREIQDEGIYDTDMEMVYNAIHNNPLMTAREYCILILGYDDMNKVRPRVTDLKTQGMIIEVGKRIDSVSNRKAIVWATLEGVQQHILKKLRFSEKEEGLFRYSDEWTILYQDFRQGKRRSYAYHVDGDKIDYKQIEVYKKFKEELNNILNKENDKSE